MTSAQTDYEDRLAELLDRLNKVWRGFGYTNSALFDALSGMHSDFKAAKFVPAWHAELMVDKNELNNGNSDKAGFLAEAMVRTVHCCGDHLAIVLIETGFARKGRKGLSYLSTIQIEDAELKAKVDALKGTAAWKYIRSFTNTSKHQGYIDRRPVRGEGCFEIEFADFPKNKKRGFGTIVRYVDILLEAVVDILDWLLQRQPRHPTSLTGPSHFRSSVCATTSVYPLDEAAGISLAVTGRLPRNAV